MHRIDEPHPFSLETATAHYAADRPVQQRHLELKLALDFDRHQLSGTATLELEAVREVSVVTLDAVDLQVSRVTVDGKRVDFDASGRHLHVHLGRARKAGQAFTLAITYETTPRRGLYFVGPDAGYPDRPLQAWTQGQDEDARCWFPCLDAPAQKCSTAVHATFPKRMTALSNGKLLSDRVEGARRTMSFALDAPHSPYLVTLVVGEFERHTLPAGKAKVHTLVAKGRGADAKRCVARVPKMLAVMEDVTGEPYPYGDYAQVFVSEFIFGGMENTSATTLTDAVLFDARAAPDYSAETLLVHELAHQWFGDLLTCRDWPHGWLNEGFATYAEIIWKERADSLDEADHQRKIDLDAYLEEVSSRYSRPIVARSFDQPIDLFDRHLYEKGALVLHELRRRLGDADFFAVLKAYVAAHRFKAVETVDLQRTIEAVTGKNFDRFFDEYVLRAGHVALSVNVSFDVSARLVRVTVKQTQEAAFHLPLTVELVSHDKQTTTHVVELSAKEHRFTFPSEREPQQVVIDGRREVLGTVSVEKPVGYWRAEVRHASSARARSEAATALGKDGGAASLDALRAVLLDEKEFWATRAACARALGVARSPQAKAALLEALRIKHSKARRVVATTLAVFEGDADVARALEALCRSKEPSLYVLADAARSLGKVRGKAAIPTLKKLVAVKCFQDVVRQGALDGLAATKDASVWPVVVGATKYGAPQFARRAAMGAVARLAERLDKRTEAVELISKYLRDGQFRMRLAAIDAATTLGDARLVGPLTSTQFLDGRERRHAREAARSLRQKSPPKELGALRAELDALKNEVKALKEKVNEAKKPA